MRNFSQAGIDTGGRISGKIRTTCPKCRDTRTNHGDKSLSVDLDTGWCHCFHCEANFRVPDLEEERLRRQRRNRQQRLLQAQTATKRYVCPLFVEANLDLPEPIANYLVKQRGLSLQTLRRLKVTGQWEAMPSTTPGAPFRDPEPCIGFNYFEEGRLVNTKFRTLQKGFKMVKGAELIPYNLDSLKGKESCYIVEGEIDALTLHEVGRTAVISVPAGGNTNSTWLDRFMESHFDDMQTIYLATDNDANGLKMRHELIRRFGEERCRVVTFSPDCKDANEELMRHGRESLLRCLDEAGELPLEDVVTANDLRDDLKALFENGLTHGAQTALANFDRLCTFETGRLLVVTGRPGDGKSEFVDELITRLALLHDWKTLFFSPENQPLALHQCKLIERIAGEKFRRSSGLEPQRVEQIIAWLSENIFHLQPGIEAYTLDRVLGTARQMVVRRGIRILVIDPLNRLEQQLAPGQTELQYISDLLNRLSRFAVQNHCLVILVAHPRKVNRNLSGELRRVEMNDINGSADFANKCDYCLVVERDRSAKVTRVHVEKVRFRHLGETGHCSFSYNTDCGRYQPCRERLGGNGHELFDVEYPESFWEACLKEHLKPR
ncbi:MAG: toprim domain-containing protein [Bacteroides sp.]|nr:toprim domain-containing protein [Bacteroides sp.]